MWETIDRLRRQPKAVRNQVAFLVALVLALVVTGAWSLTLPQRLSALAPLATSTMAAAPVAPSVSVWDSLRSFPNSVAQVLSGSVGPIVVENEPESTVSAGTSSIKVWSAGAPAPSVPVADTSVSGRPILISTSSPQATTSTP